MNITGTSIKTIRELYAGIKNGTIILNPPFQRRLVWNQNHKENFITTILDGYPFPEIYVANKGIELDNISDFSQVIVDGQQRLSTLMNYIDGDIPCNKIPIFNSLNDSQKKDFLNYQVSIRDFGDLEPNVIKEIFKRINETSYALNSVEINNALYDGSFIQIAKMLSEQSDFKQLIPFNQDDKISRMQDVGFVLLILSTIEKGYFKYDDEIEKCIVEFDNEYCNKDVMQTTFINTCKIINSLELDCLSLWYGKASFFTLFIELFKVLHENVPLDIPTIQNKLLDLEEKIRENKNKDRNDNDYAKYHFYVYSGSSSRNSRVERGRIFCQSIFNV